MQYTRLGSSGLQVSRLALGGTSFGHPDPSRAGTLDEDLAAPIFRRAVDLGITFWDTANVYCAGSSEKIVGRAIRRYARLSQLFHFCRLRVGGHGRLNLGAVKQGVDEHVVELLGDRRVGVCQELQAA